MIVSRVDPTPLVNETSTTSIGSPAPTSELSGESFGDILVDAVQQASRADALATQKAEALASGAIDDLHGTMISLKEADIAVKLVGTVRNKILDAFNELWRTSV